jgi:hypothetical protein
MVLGVAASFPTGGLVGRAMRWQTVAFLAVGSINFVGCLRFRYLLP